MPIGRYKNVDNKKLNGAHYTPSELSDFVAENIVSMFPKNLPKRLRIIDPAIGDGELLLSLYQHISKRVACDIEIHGFETNQDALNIASKRLLTKYPDCSIRFKCSSFLDYVLQSHAKQPNLGFYPSSPTTTYHFLIANPPYVRTQVMGASASKQLAKQFNLTGRIDLYYPFIISIAQVLEPGGIAGIIVSNRFLTTKSGRSVRKALLEQFEILHIWDMGDTKLFDAAVLPAVLLLRKKSDRAFTPKALFSSIYETSYPPDQHASSILQGLKCHGNVKVPDGRTFLVKHGNLNNSDSPTDVWCVQDNATRRWLSTVNAHTYAEFRDIGKVRVGVKTTADKVFIKRDWMSEDPNAQPELLRELITHHSARRFRAAELEKPFHILYPHETVNGRRQACNLADHPKSAAYLNGHKETLARRKYVLQAGRNWYEIWVPHDPDQWKKPKLVFRDISVEPTFWLDETGAIINGDCYWMAPHAHTEHDLLYLALAVSNSQFIEEFYDNRFNNKLYAGRRRFMTQYVEHFPIPDPSSCISVNLVAIAKDLHRTPPISKSDIRQKKLDHLVYQGFGLLGKEVAG